MTQPIPPLFVSHGAPDLVLKDSAANRFLRGEAGRLPRPRAILVASAHFAAARPSVVTDPAPGMIYDFGGFDPRLRQMTYPAPGAPEVAEQALRLLGEAGFEAHAVGRRGYDHGTWVPLMLLYPEADIPVVQMSVAPRADAAWHYRLGRALRPLAGEGVLVLGSGAITHNLAEYFQRLGRAAADETPEPWMQDFVSWMAERLRAGDVAALLDYRARAPHAVANHPTDEHLLPLFVALGAAGDGAMGQRLHASTELGVLAMDAFAFLSPRRMADAA